MVFGTTGQEIPEDLELVRRARYLITSSIEVRSLVFAVLEFAEIFGANTHLLADEIEQLDRRRVDGNKKYIEGDCIGAATIYEEIIGDYQDIQDRAMTLKDRALLWVYLIEWLAVSGTSLLSGLVLYSLMVRRKMYHEVEITKTVSRRRQI